MWEFKRRFIGEKKEFDLERIKHFLNKGYFKPPFTVFNQKRELYIEGDYTIKSNTFPEMLIEQNPNKKFALHLSGGFDSSILAKLYDREDATYIHIGYKEYPKAKALADTLKGELIRFDIDIKEWLKTADEILPKYTEPECDPASVLSYIASKKAKDKGYDLIITGDMSDDLFGGHGWGPDSEFAMDMWKSIEPNRLLGLKTFLPFGHPKIREWVKKNLLPAQVKFDKLFLRNYCKQLGLPDKIVNQEKAGWSGCWDFLNYPGIMDHLKSVIDMSNYEFKDFPVDGTGLFRKYSLIKWLEVNQ